MQRGSDPRRPNGPVPAAVKWFNDSLDVIAVDSLARGLLATTSYRDRVGKTELSITSALRTLDGSACETKVRMCTPIDDSSDVDHWGIEEEEGFRHVWKSIVLCPSGVDVDVTNALLHGVVTDSGWKSSPFGGEAMRSVESILIHGVASLTAECFW